MAAELRPTSRLVDEMPEEEPHEEVVERPAERGPRPALRRIREFLGETLHRCAIHATDTQSAAIAFYTLFSLVPVLLAASSMARRFLGEREAGRQIARQLQGIMGSNAGLAVEALLERAPRPETGVGYGGVLGIVVFVLGATAGFIQLQEALNRVWEVAPRPGQMLRSFLRRRLLSFGLVLTFGLLAFVSMTLSAALLALTDFLATRVPIPLALVTFGNEVLSFLVLAVLIALVYRVLPDARLEWWDVRVGAVASSALFSIGKWAIGFYLGRSAAATQFGVAGSLAVVLLWVYYASYILLFGAELTAVYSSRYRRQPVTPEPGAGHARSAPLEAG